MRYRHTSVLVRVFHIQKISCFIENRVDIVFVCMHKMFREKTEQLLKDWLKIPFKIIDHLSGIRPATLERRPFVGLHPLHPNIGILNGMGTKGCSLAPFFANQLVDHLLHNKPITPEADIKRFSKILARH